MTDGRIPGNWITEPRFVEMPDDIFGFLARAIAWSNEAGTDGAVKQRYLAHLHSDGHRHPAVYDQLEQQGLWEKTADGYQFRDWTKPSRQGGMGQSSAETVRSAKKASARRQQKFREKRNYAPTEADVTALHTAVTERRDTGQDVGQDTTGQAEYGEGYQKQEAHQTEWVANPPPVLRPSTMTWSSEGPQTITPAAAPQSTECSLWAAVDTIRKEVRG